MKLLVGKVVGRGVTFMTASTWASVHSNAVILVRVCFLFVFNFRGSFTELVATPATLSDLLLLGFPEHY